MIDWKKRFRNKMFWVAMFALIAITGQAFNLYSVPDNYDVWVNAVLVFLAAAGVISDPTTEGFGDHNGK